MIRILKTSNNLPDLSSRDPAALVRRRRRIRMARFVVAETVVIALMIGSVVAGVSARFAHESFTPIFRVLPITAAVVATILPIIFFGDPKRGRR
jgi:hypothetical protein